jgi:uroporphyrinogen decarboxylase
MEVLKLTAREIIQKRMHHEGTRITPYTVSVESELRKKLAEYYKDENWEQKKLRRFIASYMRIDTVLMEAVDEKYSKDAYGAVWRMDRKPWHLEEVPLKEADIDHYDFPSREKFLKPIFENKNKAIKSSDRDNEHYRIISMGWGIFEHTWRIRGFENALMDTITDRDFYSELTKKLTDLYIEMIKSCEDVPAEAYLFGDDWGQQTGLLISKESWRILIKPCWERIYSEVHRQGKKVIQHSCGSICEIYDDLIEIGLDCHESVQPEATGMNPEIIKREWGKKISFWGCLGSQGILHFGTPEEIRKEILRLHNLFKEDGGYILAPAKPLPDEMPVDKAVAVIETLSELNI